MRSRKKQVTSRVDLTETFVPGSSERISKRRTIALEDCKPVTVPKIRTTRRNERKNTTVPKPSQRVPKRQTTSRKRPEPPEEPEIYKHQRLDTSTDEIRLLRLFRETKGPVHCEVKVFPLERAPEYIALSYRWGPPSPLHNLYIEGKTLKIRDILNSCLLELREDLEAWLWIDQICIAQEDSLERNHQVGMMSRIYSNGKSVIIWMGDIPLAASGEYDLHNDSDLDIASARVLFKNTYFTRLWIFQEVFLASSIDFRINGHRCVTWDRFQSLSSSGLEVDSSTIIPTYLLMHTASRRESWALGLYLPLVDCILALHVGICENPRDKVYGLMGMVREEERVVVDYEKSVLEVYMDFMHICMTKELSSDLASRGRPELIARCNIELGRSMGIGDDLLLGVQRLITNRFTVHKNDTVTATGLEEAGQAYEQHHWWYECSGERHHFCCQLLSDSEHSEISNFMGWN
jgi:hypothetical protein